MNYRVIFLVGAIFLTLSFCTTKKKDKNGLSLTSPEDIVNIHFYLDQNGQPGYKTTFKKNVMIDSSSLGLVLSGEYSLDKGFEVLNSTETSFDETWEQPWGEERFIRNNYKELTVNLENEAGLKLDIVLRAYDNGVAFRYVFPEQEQLKEFEVMDELTEFRMADDHLAWWIPAYSGNRYEQLYTKSGLSEMEKVHTPLTIETKRGFYISIHEAALTDFSSMVIENRGDNVLKCDLVPFSTTDPVKSYVTAPFHTPWRTIIVGEKPGELITNYVNLNLNEPNKLDDISWIKPGKYIGVWWEMFINVGTWAQGPKHAANTGNVKKYIDFAAENGFDGVLVEGWNYGWDGDWMGGGTTFDFTKPYPDYDVEELSRYAKEKGVYIIGHHETGADIVNYENQLEDAYQFLEDHGMRAVKTGYVEHGDTLPNGYYHHGQYFVRHFEKVIETAATHKVMIVAHEPIKDTGKRRTFPNMVSREGAKGQEYNAMGGNSADHVTIIPFTRSLSGPFDYTPGVFDVKLKTMPNDQVKTTLVRELALYVVIYAPMQMACDLPENYEGHPAFEFIRQVPTDWETTRVLEGEIGEYVTIARQERDTDNWFIGAITNENPRTASISFNFLEPEKTYKATIYKNSPDTDMINNPTGYEIDEMEITTDSRIELQLASAGGAAIAVYPVE